MKAERRKTKRRPVLDSFAVFVVVPKKGYHRLAVLDLSDDGIGFQLDTEGESPEDFRAAVGDKLDLRFYLNQSLYLPLTVEIARLEDDKGMRRVGAAFADKSAKAYHVLASFITMLDILPDVARFDE